MSRPSRIGLPGLLFLFALGVGAFGAARAATTEALENAAAPIDLMEFVVEGNTVLAGIVIERELTPFLGPGRSVADVEAARGALEKAYQTAGFLTVFVDVPEQRVDSGLVRLVVTEGRVEALRVKGSRYYSQGYIRGKVEQLAEGKVPNFNTLQNELAVLNRGDDRQVRPIMRPGQAPGTVEADLQVTDRLPLSGTVELHNQHAANTTETRLAATLRYDNLFQVDHSLAMTLITAPQRPSESKVLALNYLVPLDRGDSLLASLTASDSVVEPLGATNVVGKGLTLGARYVKPFGTAAGEYHTLSLGVDFKNLKQRIQSGTDSLDTPLRYLPFTLAYSGSLAGEGGALTTLAAQWLVAFGPVLARKVECPGNIGPVDQFACSREGAEGSFATLKVDLRHVTPWSLGGTLALRLGGQLASGPVVSAEQFFAGGANSVRGYLESEATGDIGANASIEWRSKDLRSMLGLNTVAPSAGARPGFTELTGYGFIDAARAQSLLASAGQPERTHLIGSGLGLRVRGWKALSGELEIAWPHKLTSNTVDHSPRLHFRFGVSL